MARTLSFTEQLMVVQCWCGMHHAIPEGLYDFQQRRHDDGEREVSVYCPLGHTHHPAGTSKWATERKAREAAEARATSLADQLAAADKEAKRLARRARNGVCPCCHRSFANVKKHMDNRHPTYQS
jgi:hypothetical protein